MRLCVTGAAGFIGSHLAEALIECGHDVVGIDCFTPYYSRSEKERNLALLRKQQQFRLLELDLCSGELLSALQGVEYLFHQAGQPGVRLSWGEDFSAYALLNIVATQRLLEAVVAAGVSGMVYASSSSVYGNSEALPTGEDALPQPISPYGVTKLAAEHLCRAYGQGFGFPVAALRYFTVYGPRQRPDMGFRRFIDAALNGEPITVYGDGSQTRDFTFVSDAVEANLSALKHRADGIFNIGGGSRVSLLDVLAQIQAGAGKQPQLEFFPRSLGDALHTSARTDLARACLGYRPLVGLTEGLARQVAWQASLRDG